MDMYEWRGCSVAVGGPVEVISFSAFQFFALFPLKNEVLFFFSKDPILQRPPIEEYMRGFERWNYEIMNVEPSKNFIFTFKNS